MTATKPPAAPVMVWAVATFGPVAGRQYTVAAARCPGRCADGVHLHRITNSPQPEGHLRKAPCGSTYRVLVASEVQVRCAA